MLLKNMVAVITGGAGVNGLGYRHGAPDGRARRPRRHPGSGPRRPAAAAARLGEGHLGLVADVTDKAACEAAAAEVLKTCGRIDILVNNAGITQPVKTLEITGADYDRILDVSLRGTLLHVAGGDPRHAPAAVGSIVCISSVSAQRGGGIFGGPHYSAAKAGVLGLARADGARVRRRGHPRQLHHPRPDRDRHHPGQADPDKKAEIAETIPLARLGRPTTWPEPACSWPATLSATAPASRST
jgi:NAD(P)-dependent dehydrogenase (short-subunit alcohol dehydrogenase family)